MNNKKDKYLYSLTKKDSFRVRTLGILGLISTALLIIGFYSFAKQSMFVALLTVPFFTIVSFYHTINFFLMSCFTSFDIRAHQKKVECFKQQGTIPKIAVMIPVAGEDIQVVSETMHAALAIDYPNYNVFVLDDSKDAMYRNMVINSRAGYFRRSKLGFHKKAGNLNSLLSKLDGYDQVLVLDADFVARPEILYELAAYSASDVGIIQSPQHFRLDSEVYKRSKFEYGAGLIQRDFYRITQPARQRFGGSICVGTNALYNVQALKDVGGFEGVGRKEWGHSEDVHTGLKMINTLNSKKQRYHIQYVPIQLAQGTCPADHLSFYKQQNRWATGSMQLIFSKKTLFSRRLSFFQKICYFSNSVYYFYTISLLFAPVQLLLLLLANTQYDWSYTLLFIPMLLLSNFAVPIILRRPIKPIATTLVVLSNAYTFAQALFLLFIRKPLGWEATGAGGKKKRNLQFSLFKIFCSGFFLAIYLLTLAVLILNQRIGFNPSTFIIIVFLSAFIAHMVYLHYMLSADIIFKKLYVSRHAYAYVIIFGATILTIFASVYYSGSYGFGVKKDSSIGLYQK